MHVKRRFFSILAMLILLIGCQNNQVNYQNVSAKEAKQMIEQEKITVLDVRTPEEFAEGHIQKAMLIPLQDLSEALNQLDPSETYLVVCRSGNRSAQASELLIQNGFENIYNMTGGLTSWDGEIVK